MTAELHGSEIEHVPFLLGVPDMKGVEDLMTSCDDASQGTACRACECVSCGSRLTLVEIRGGLLRTEGRGSRDVHNLEATMNIHESRDGHRSSHTCAIGGCGRGGVSTNLQLFKGHDIRDEPNNVYEGI